MKLSQSQVAELKDVARQSGTAHLRVKALALLSCGEGRSNSEVAAIFQVGRSTVAAWRRRYEAEGIEGFRVKPGRGRPRKADPDEIARYILQSPRNFGIERTRWTLDLLAQTVPSLKGFTRYGVQQALRKAGFRYKRGQPSLHSPDPEYGQKEGLWTRP